MKLSTSVILSLVAGASAFTPAPKSVTTPRSSTVVVSMVDEDVAQKAKRIKEGNFNKENPLIPDDPQKSEALPWMNRPPALDGSLAGDAGFDPVGFATDQETLLKYREAEIKHGRLAMLAAAGWPLSELFNKKLSNLIGASSTLNTNDRVPSVLNGGFEKTSSFYWVACLASAAAIDVYGLTNKKDNAPGDLGFDPLDLYPKDPEGQERMKLSEIKNGRLAMIAITAFAFQEFATKLGVVDQTPFFFKPLGAEM